MYLNKWIAHENMRRTFFIAALALLTFATGMLAGCGGNSNQANTSNAGNNNANTKISGDKCPSRGGESKERSFAAGDTPIIVTGGSTKVDLTDENIYMPVNGTNNFVATDKQIDFVEIEDTTNGRKSRYWVPASGLCTIKIHAKRNGGAGDESPITITGSKNAQNQSIVTVTFDKTEYGQNGGFPHNNPSNKFKDDVEIIDNTPATPVTYFGLVEKNNGKSTVTVHTFIPRP